MTKRITIADVAERAGVGKVTVSYVLNGRADEMRISSQTQERILAAAKELDYRPNGVARMLSRKQSDIVAVIFQDPNYFSLGSTFLNEVLHGVCRECVEQKLDLMLHTRPSENVFDEANALSDGRIDGLLALRDEDDATLRALIRRKFPLVLFFSRPLDPDIAYVDCDNYTGGKIAAQHLLSLGHKRLGMVVGPQKSVDSADRYQGFASVVQAAGHSIDPAHIVPFNSPKASAEDFAALLKKKDRPTAFFVWSDDVAFECMKVAKGMGLRLPEDLSLVGFDSTPACDLVEPKLTSIRQPVEDMARAATRILAAIIREEEGEATHLVFPPQLVVRASTAAPSDARHSIQEDII
ncbi:MAG: LacI family DNA-binding transcriptional regulator [Chthonomonas sp.]|nr:LacI family DNA-binding transcriptional regulator [Chthonomonas sp.]